MRNSAGGRQVHGVSEKTSEAPRYETVKTIAQDHATETFINLNKNSTNDIPIGIPSQSGKKKNNKMSPTFTIPKKMTVF
jgi:hypothetical protein